MVKEFFIATSFEEALEAKKNGYAFYAGGTDINRLDSEIRTEKAVSLAKLGLDKIEEGCIGSMVTFQQIIESSLVPEQLKTACRFNISLQNRNRATIGGNIALKRDDSYLIPYLVAAEAKLLVHNHGEVSMPDYLDGDFSDKIIEKILIKSIPVAQKRIARPVRAHAVLTAAVGPKTGCVAIKGMSLIVLNGLKGVVTEEAARKKMEACDGLKPTSDLWGSGDYKKYLVKTVVPELLKEVRE